MRCRCGETRDDIPLLPFPSRQILPCEQIPISSVIAQNPPALLPPRSVCPLPICPGCRCRSQPLPGVSRKQRYNTLDFPTENRVPTGMLLAPIGNPEPKELRPSGHPFMFVQRPSISSGAVGFFLPEHETVTQI